MTNVAPPAESAKEWRKLSTRAYVYVDQNATIDSDIRAELLDRRTCVQLDVRLDIAGAWEGSTRIRITLGREDTVRLANDLVQLIKRKRWM